MQYMTQSAFPVPGYSFEKVRNTMNQDMLMAFFKGVMEKVEKKQGLHSDFISSCLVLGGSLSSLPLCKPFRAIMVKSQSVLLLFEIEFRVEFGGP